MACTEQVFLKDVAEHQMTVLRDDGVYRHVRFRRPGTFCMGFDLVTWPGYLSYTGDMGAYVFTRLEDMFAFFRIDRPREDSHLRINREYWAEKCVAADRDGVKAYSPERFAEAVASWLDNSEASLTVRSAVAEEVLPHAHDGEYAAHQAARDFERDGFTFQDFWEADLREYTHRFTWCCYALAWGIEQYDHAKDKTKAA